MIIDFHTHAFSPQVRDGRSEYLERDPTFRELYSNEKAVIATADGLLESMEKAGIDVSVVLGFAWQDHDLCRRHNDYLLEAAQASGGRLVPFCIVQPKAGEDARDEMQRVAARGARGLGELRPLSQGYDLVDSDEADLLAWASSAWDLPLLFHASEPVGHPYPGKRGLELTSLYHFVRSSPGTVVVAAHWGGGLPFYSLMPEVTDALASTYFDTAATSLLYDTRVFRLVSDAVGPQRILFGSDFPLLDQSRCLEAVRKAPLSEEERRLILGENARRLLRLPAGGQGPS